MSSGKKTSQKFIGRNRPPRVQIEYDLETYGADEKKEIPFVMGIMSDLSGDRKKASLDKFSERKFLEIDADNFEDRMKAINPDISFKVQNTLTGKGQLNVDLDFESMHDFTPGAIAKNVKPLEKLLETRTELNNLMSYMDGKSDAEDLVKRILENPELMKSLAATSKQSEDEEIGNISKDDEGNGDVSEGEES